MLVLLFIEVLVELLNSSVVMLLTLGRRIVRLACLL